MDRPIPSDFYRENGAYILGKTYEEGKTKGTVSLFNACARSDGAAVVIVTSEERARDLDLEILAEVHSWGFWGSSPAYMGIAPVFATSLALDRRASISPTWTTSNCTKPSPPRASRSSRSGKKNIVKTGKPPTNRESSTPTAEPCLSAIPWRPPAFDCLLNLIFAMKEDPHSRLGLAAACASGGLGGAMILKRFGA
jgi:acetyl-CoA C-acetyltransferase